MQVIFIMVILCVFSSGLVYTMKMLVMRKLLCINHERTMMALSDVLLNVSVWMAISVSFSVYNKFFYSAYNGIGFPFPALTTMVHELVKFGFSRVWSYSTRTEVTKLPFMTTLLVVIPIGMTSALDIALSNYSFETISVSVYTIIKSSNVIFIFLFGLLLGLEQFDYAILGSIVAIVVGFVLSLYSSSESEPWGLAACLASTLLSALRWTLVHYLVSNDPQSRNPVVVLYRIAPAALGCMVPIFFYSELSQLLEYASYLTALEVVKLGGLISIGGVLGIVLLLLEINLLSLTSALTFSVIGAGKELLQISLAIIILMDDLTITKAAGITISILGVVSYNAIKAKKKELASSASPAGLNSPDKGYMRVAANELADAFDTGAVNTLEMTEAGEIVEGGKNFFE